MTFSRKGREKKGWKAFQLDYDFVFSQSNRYCSYCLNDQQIAALLTMTNYVAWPTRWVKTGDDPDRDFIQAFADRLERDLMAGCCDDNMPIQYRYSTTGILQRSLNAGNDWIDSPEYDPRVYSPRFPPATGTDGLDKKCIAATGAVLLIHEQIGDQLTDDMSRYTLNQLITDWVKTFIQSSNPFAALLQVIANQIFALVIAALRPALTDAVYDQLVCILYCRMAADASFNTAQWQSVRSDITAQISGIAGIFFEHLVYLLGEGGLTNLARSGAATEGDCSACTECLACSQRWSIFGAGHGTIDEVNAEEGWIIVSSSSGGGDKYLIIKTPSMDIGCYVDHIENISGSFTLEGWTDKGQPQIEGVPQHTGLGFGDCANYVQLQSAITFTSKIFFTDCAP